MDWLRQILDIFLHLDRHLHDLAAQYGLWTYVILFAIVFCETGLVVTPFLPGDSLLFAAGALAGSGAFDPWILTGVLCVAAVLGDTVNYQIGHLVGPKIFTAGHSRWFRKEHLDRTHRFFEKYGGKTIVIARFVPIVRTFAPFVAGVGSMTYARFLAYNVVGGIAWVVSFVWAGYWFGSREIVRENFSLVIVAIIILSLLPALWEYLRVRRETKRESASSGRPAGPS